MRTRLENVLPNEDHSNNLEDGANCWAADQLDKVVSNVVEDSNKEEARQMTIDLHAKGLPETVCCCFKTLWKMKLEQVLKEVSILLNLSHLQMMLHT